MIRGELVVTRAVRVPETELRWRFSRSGGPGGQHADTSDTRVSLSFDLEATRALSLESRERAVRRLGCRLSSSGVLTVTVDDTRSQARNRERARERLAAILGAAITSPRARRRATRPGRAVRERRLANKRRRSEVKRTRASPRESDGDP